MTPQKKCLRRVHFLVVLTGKDVLPEKDLLEKATTMKRFEYSLLGKELKAQTDKETVSKIRQYF